MKFSQILMCPELFFLMSGCTACLKYGTKPGPIVSSLKQAQTEHM